MKQYLCENSNKTKMNIQQKSQHLQTPSRKMHLSVTLKKHALIVSILLLNAAWLTGGKPAQNEVMVLEGHEADIPCVTTSSLTPSSNLEEKVSKPKPDRPNLILWYKDGVRSSIYSYDGRDADNERHWSIRRSMGGALSLTLPASPNTRPQLAFLNIGHTHQTDAGVYHCQVDFKRGPGRSTYTKLIVVVPPTTPTVEVWAGGRWLHTTHETSTATVEVGTKLTLRCSTSGGKPSPTVTWWRGGQQLLGKEATTADGRVSSSVNVTVMEEDAHTPIVCQATNTHLIPPLRTPLLLLVLSPPKWLRVVGADRTMSAGMTYTVECRCVGARPPPVITWSVGGDELHHASSTTNSEGETISRLRFTPKAAHSGTHITCAAHPPEHSQSAASPHSTPTLWVKSDSTPLKILYKPEVHLNIQLIKRKKKKNKNSDSSGRPPPFSPSTHINHNPFFKSNQSANSEATEEAITNDEQIEANQKDADKESDGVAKIKKDKHKPKKKESKSTKSNKGNDRGVVSVEEFAGVVLQCNVRANPPAYHVSWHRNGIPLSPIASPGLMVGNMSAIFPTLKRTDAGNITCTAHNTEGSTRSKPVQLHVKHGPECARDSVKVIGVPRHHTLNVTCEVEAYPLPTSFSWALRSSRGILAVPPEMITFSGTTSWITYTPRGNIDFGDLLCWAHTPNGRQEDPCVAKLVSAEKPDTPEDCKVTRRSPNKLTVSCKAAHDGGLPQTFFMRVFHAGLLVTNSTSVTPVITAYDLEPNTRYLLTLWSANTHGTSTGHTTLYSSTLPANSSSTTSSMNGHSSSHGGLLSKFGSSILAVVVVVTVVGVVIGIVVGIMVQRIDGRDNHSQHPQDDDDEGEERPPTLINNNQINVAMAGIGRRAPKCLEPLGKSTTHYDILTVSGVRNDKHVYDDPITLRGGISHQVTPPTENIEVTHNIRYPTFSMTAADLGYHSQNFSWHLPNSRLLRNKFNQRYPPTRGHPRKPMRVETPRLPEFDLSTNITRRQRIQSPPGMEFTLILVPEKSKMIQVALERNNRLASYLSHDAHLSNSPSKFPTITEEEEVKPMDDDILEDNHSATPYESTPDDFTIENGQSDTSELIPRQDHIIETRAMIHSENQELNRNKGNHYTPLNSQVISEPVFDGLQITPENIPTITIYRNGHARQSNDIHSEKQRPLRMGRTPNALQNITNAKISRPQKSSLSESSWDAQESRMKIALLGHQEGKEGNVPKRTVPSIPLVGKLSRHHPYGMGITGIRRGLKTPPAPSVKRKMDNTVNSSGGNTPNLIPSSPLSLLRKPKVGVTSLLSLVSSSSASSTSSSSYASKRGKGSRETTTSPLSDGRRRACSVGAKKSSPSFKNPPKLRPRSIQFISGPEQVLQRWEETECQSASTPSSPRSSTSSSSSCFPYSSMSSSPISSFYSSENSLSISATFSQTSSSSSFCFSSASSSASSSPFSSFLSPSLTTPSASSALSLSSCPATPDSVLSGHITPT